MTKPKLLAACAFSALVLTVAGPAAARQAAATAPEQRAEPSPSSSTAQSPASGAENGSVQAPAANDGGDQGDIIVTAQGRAQALENVPVAISAVSAATLANSGANDIRQLNQLAPSLLVSSTGNEANGSARIRGIGTVGDNPGLESSVAVFIDGVYRSRSGIGLNELGDIDRIEVLRGPQGTLFGRNASAGIISITSKSPSFAGFGAGAEATYGNYDYYRVAGNVNVPLGEQIAARVDGVYVKRDGFLKDRTTGDRINDRDRYFLRGQLLFEPSSDLTVRLIGDYTHRNEACCGAVYVNEAIDPSNRNLLTPLNPIIKVLTGLGQPTAAFSQPYSRNVYTSPGRSYDGHTQDWGASGQIDYNLGGAKLTSITAYRSYDNDQAGDVDYSYADLLYRAPGKDAGGRAFRTFSQELRLQGELFGGKLDWLVGGFYANEDLTVRENLKFGSDYGRFAACRLVVSALPAAAYSPGTVGCLNPAVAPLVFGAATPLVQAGLANLDSVRNVGETGSVYKQNSVNYAAFTHNIVHLSDTLDLTIGLRYTHERKRLDATFANNNTACVTAQASPLLGIPALAAVAQGLVALACQGNSSAAIDGKSVHDRRSENRLTGTAILSWKPFDDLLLYGSYARGYKAGGFNLDRSALKPPTSPFPADLNTLVKNLEFDEETNNAFEVGAKFSRRGFSLNIAAFRQEFSNFQLNTFNGSVFLVQTINGCSDDLAGGDRDLAAATGACAADHSRAGVISQGVEVESSLSPARDVRIGLGATFAHTYYRDNLIGNQNGAPLDPALRLLPGRQLSNAPRIVTTASAAWTPSIGSSGLSALVYMDGRMTSDYNTGSNLYPQKRQDGYVVANARIGLRGRDEKWAIEFWGQNVFNTNYTQVAFDAPFQAAQGTGANPNFPAATYPAGTQVFAAFLAEPRTYGVTLRGKF